MLLRGITYIRDGQRVYKRVGSTDAFRLEMTFSSVSGAKRFCEQFPERIAVRHEWVVKKLSGKQLPKLYE